MRKLMRRAQYWLRRERLDAELAEEMEYHRSLLHRDGAPRTAMGSTTLAREDARAVWIWPWLESTWQDVAYGFRTLRAQPGFVLVALVALGSGIGLNTSLFTVFNAVALRPWPVRDPARVVNFWRVTGDGTHGFGVAEYRYLSEHAKSTPGLILYDNGEKVKLADRPLETTYVSGNYFQVLGVPMVRGRGFLAEEDVAGSPQAVAVIGEALWRQQLDAAPDIVGRSVRLDDVAFTIVGVASGDFTGTSPIRNDVWVPLTAKLLLRPHQNGVREFLTKPGNCCISMSGRLGPGVTRTQAQAELTILSDQFHAENHMDDPHSTLVATSTSWMGSPRKKANIAPALFFLFLAMTLILVLACANVGNLLLARASARRQEIAIRLSLGGSRARVIRQLLVESSMLAAAAAGAGLAMAYVVPPAIMRWLGTGLSFDLTPDLSVLGYTMAVAALACLAFGLAPALHGTRGNIAVSLKAESRERIGRLPLRTVLLSVQVAISVILLSGAGLLVRGLQRTQSLDPGFDVHNVTILTLDLPASQYGGARTKVLANQLVAQLDGASGLPVCGISADAPLGNSRTFTAMNFNGRRQRIAFHEVSAGYFDVLRIPVLAGRNFVPEDAGRQVAIFNEAAARRYWPGENPVGKTIEYGDGQPWTIIGIAKDAYVSDLNPIEPAMFWPMSGRSVPFVLVRGRNADAAERVAAVVKQIEPRAQVRHELLEENLKRQTEPSIFGAAIAGFLGLLALALASVGMAGVFAYMIGQRTREIGVRMALGAQPRQVVRLVLTSSLRALAFGVPAGLAGAAALSILLARTLPGVRAADPLAYAGVLVLLVVAAAVATAAPARRAARIDPVRALRWE